MESKNIPPEQFSNNSLPAATYYDAIVKMGSRELRPTELKIGPWTVTDQGVSTSSSPYNAYNAWLGFSDGPPGSIVMGVLPSVASAGEAEAWWNKTCRFIRKTVRGIPPEQEDDEYRLTDRILADYFSQHTQELYQVAIYLPVMEVVPDSESSQAIGRYLLAASTGKDSFTTVLIDDLNPVLRINAAIMHYNCTVYPWVVPEGEVHYVGPEQPKDATHQRYAVKLKYGPCTTGSTRRHVLVSNTTF